MSEFNLDRLQCLQNKLAHFVCNGSKLRDVNDMWCSLHWLAISRCIKFKVAVMMHKVSLRTLCSIYWISCDGMIHQDFCHHLNLGFSLYQHAIQTLTFKHSGTQHLEHAIRISKKYHDILNISSQLEDTFFQH